MDVLVKLGLRAACPGFQNGANAEDRDNTKLSRNGFRVETNVVQLLRRNLFGYHVPKTTVEVIRAAGYPAEVHYVLTGDGYILELHRIPAAHSSKPPVYLQHGMLCSSSVWVLQSPNRSLAFLLHDLGYDVWLGNYRGNRYGRAHTKLDPDRHSDKFWDFSFHELGVQDVPANIDHILECTGRPDLLFVGHSMGTTGFFVMMSELPEYNKKVRGMVALAPVAFLTMPRSPTVRALAQIQGPIEATTNLLGIREFLPKHLPFRFASRLLHLNDFVARTMCFSSLYVSIGFRSSQLALDMLPVVPSHLPEGTAFKTLYHYGQSINTKTFRQWDHGVSQNLKLYGSGQPPDYKLKNIQVPVSVIYAENDWLPAPHDVLALYDRLPNKHSLHKVQDPSFSHVDFTLSNSAKHLVYDDVLKILEEF